MEALYEGDEGTCAKMGSLRRRVCRTCGQHHAMHEPHVYDYVDEVDEDVTCHICLQPLVTPVDTPCGHTFCKPCLLAFFKVQQNCPIDRKPLSQDLCSFSSLVLKKLLEKLVVKCPNSEFCDVNLPRGDLEDHLKYRCLGNWVSCAYSTAGCLFRGPQKTMASHVEICSFKNQGVQRTPIVEGEVSFIEIPRTQTALGVAIVGGADTPLRCVVMQEVFPDGLIAQDKRLQAGDQIIEIENVDMTTATHHFVCSTLRRASPVLRLGIYRERVEPYRSCVLQNNVTAPGNSATCSQNVISQSSNINEHKMLCESGCQSNISSSPVVTKNKEKFIHVTLKREIIRPLGIKLGGIRNKSGIFIMEILAGSIAERDGTLHTNDRILAINGCDVRHAKLDYAFRLIKIIRGSVSIIASRIPENEENYEHLFKKPHPDLAVIHSRAKSAPERLVERNLHGINFGLNQSLGQVRVDEQENGDRSASCESLDPWNSTNLAYNTYINSSLINSKVFQQEHGSSRNSVLEASPGNRSSLSPPLRINKSFMSLISPVHFPITEENLENGALSPPALPPRSRLPLTQLNDKEFLRHPRTENIDTANTTKFDSIEVGQSAQNSTDVCDGPRSSISVTSPTTNQSTNLSRPYSPFVGLKLNVDQLTPLSRFKTKKIRDFESGEVVVGIRKSLRLEGTQLHQKTVTIPKDACESLGMRIGGGVNSNEGNIPIYIANIHPNGPVGKSKKVKKGDILLSVNGHSLLGLTHTQSVALLKATAELAGVTLSLLEGSETHTGPGNFVPSWLYWQRLPRELHLSKHVVLHRTPGASLGFSIVGGNDLHRGPESIHVLFVVATSPAAIDGRLRCGDRLLAVDGHCLEGVSHAMAVSLLKQARQSVDLEVVSWMGTEI